MTNTVLIVGNLGADPVTRQAGKYTSIATLSVGTRRPKRDAEGKTFKDASGFTAKETEWHRVNCFNGLSKTVGQYAIKGMLVSVRGRIHYTRWTDKDGIERYGCEIIAEDVQFLSRSRQGASDPAEKLQSSTAPMRWRTRRAVSGFVTQIGARASRMTGPSI